MKIYTKTGDKGFTSFIGGRVRKDDLRIEAIGNIDELNAYIGLTIESIEINLLKDQLIETQNILFTIGSILAGVKSDFDFTKHLEKLEKNIDSMESELEELRNFILPGGHRSSAHLHYLRTICRRSERVLVNYILKSKRDDLSSQLAYLNRLSDWCFVGARFVNAKNGFKDIVWRGH